MEYEVEAVWQHKDYPNYYFNDVVSKRIERNFSKHIQALKKILNNNTESKNVIMAEETIYNSFIEGDVLDRESIRSSFLNNMPIKGSREADAVGFTRMGLEHAHKPLTVDFIKELHSKLFESVNIDHKGEFIGDMKIVLSCNEKTIDIGIPKSKVDAAMDQFVEWYNTSKLPPLTKAIQGHLHFEGIHPFCDGNGRIGRLLMQMSISRDYNTTMSLAISRTICKETATYYRSLKTGLDITSQLETLGKLMSQTVVETISMLELTHLRDRLQKNEALNFRQMGVMNKWIDDELKGKSKNEGYTNSDYKELCKFDSKTVQRDLRGLIENEFLFKTGVLKGTKYHLPIASNQHSTLH